MAFILGWLATVATSKLITADFAGSCNVQQPPYDRTTLYEYGHELEIFYLQ